MFIVIMHAAGLAGGFLAKKMRIPAGWLLGAMAFVVILNMVSGSAAQPYPIDLRRLVQIAAGAVIGVSITRADLVTLRRIIKAAAVLVVMLIGFNVLFAFFVSRLTAFDPITALFATAPGGVADMALIAEDFGADTRQVAILQLFRFVFIVSLFPFIVQRMVKPGKQKTQPTATATAAETAPSPTKEETPRGLRNEWRRGLPRKLVKGIATFLAAGAGAALALRLGLPAGALIGALAVSVVLSTVFQIAWLPKWIKPAAQVFAGCFIGSQITLETLAYFRLMPLPMALVVVQLLVMTFSTAWVLRRACGMDHATSIFSSIPGGIAEMTLIAQDMGLRVPEILLMNTCRLIGVIFMMPILLLLST